MAKIPHVTVNIRGLEPVKKLIDLMVDAQDLFIGIGASTLVNDVDERSYYRVNNELIHKTDQWLRNFYDLVLQLEVEE